VRAEQLHSLVYQFLNLCRKNEIGSAGSGFELLLSFLERQKGQTVTVLSKRLRANLVQNSKSSRDNNFSSEQIVHDLVQLREFLRVAQSKKAVIDSLSIFLEVLEEFSCLAPQEIFQSRSDVTAENLGAPKKPKSILRSNVVEKYSKVLKEAASALRHNEFDSILYSFSIDKQVRKSELQAIATEFLGYKVPSKATKDELLEMVKDRYNVNVRQKARWN